MVTNSKVLTVSYGTFSCTLEGFEESFDTMKVIAEYFRDLAADDRYFGAEPPTPDAEMLARIAEREIERRVQARTEHGAIVLSAGTPFETADVVEDTSAFSDAEEVQDTGSEVSEENERPVIDVQASEIEAVIEAAEEIVEEEEKAEEVEAEIETGSDAIPDATVTEDEFAEHAPAAKEQVEVVAEDAVVEETDDEDTALAAMISRVEAQDEIADYAAEVEETAIEDIAEDTTEDTMIASVLETNEDVSDADEDPDPVAEPVAEFIEPEAPKNADENSIAAKLQRIRAVVSKSAEQPDDDDFNEDEHAEILAVEPGSDAAPVLQLDIEMAAAAEAEDARSSDKMIQDGQTTPEAMDTPEPPIRARIIRMKKADFESALGDGLLEAVPVDDEDDDFGDDVESSLSAQEEAELLAELAQVEAELNSADQDDDPVEAIGAEEEDDVEGEHPARGHHLTEVTHNSDADMSRLMSEAQNQLNEPEGSRRRQAIAHLRAAVAATKAEKSAGVEEDTADAAEAYRDDLASVVRPVPAPVTSAAQPRADSDAEDKRPRDPTPLKLVAEQRVDTIEVDVAPSEMTPRNPIRPRRVSAVDAGERVDREAFTDRVALGDTNASEFAEFAEQVGAVQLREILEAAVAYLTFVEGHDIFSRPMVMRMLSSMDEQDFSREDSLRGFGQLLRENKIEKVSGGRFTASDEIGFKPEGRAAG